MKIKDYLHSDLLRHKCNDEIFQETYKTIEKLTFDISHAESIALDLHDDGEIKKLFIKNGREVSQLITDLINLTIHKFNKDG